MRRTATILGAAFLMLFSIGCFEIEQTIDLKRDMSGSAGVKIGVDFEPMVVIMAQVQREMKGEKGPATKAEIEAAKADFRKNAKKTSSKTDVATMRKELEQELPEGVKLLDADVKETEFAMTSNFRFAFDKLQRLINVKLPGAKGDDPTKKNVVDSPFDGLDVTDDGKTLTIRTKPQNPAAAVEKEAESSGAPVDPDTEKLMKDAFKNLRVAYRITAPFEVVSHNATRREGQTLIWEYTIETFEKMEKAKKLDDAGVKVVYKK